jgi:dipeptidyl aminopeptidase/acylaminoacyl peptidase
VIRIRNLVEHCGAALVASLILAPAASAAAPDSLLSLDRLTGPARYSVPELSPDGRYLSFMAPVDGALNLWVGPADSPAAARPVTHVTGRGLQPWDVSGNVLYHWNGSSTRIIYPRDNNGDENWQLYSVDLVSGEEKQITSLHGGSVRVIEMSDEHPNEILIGINDRNPRWFDPWKLDLATGKMERVEQNDRFVRYLADHDLRLRLAVEVDANGAYQLSRRAASGGWEHFYEIPMDETAQTHSIGFDGANRALIGYGCHDRNTAAIIERDLESGAVRVLAEDAQVDVGPVLEQPRNHRIQAYGTNYTRLEWHALDPAIAPDLAALKNGTHGDFTVESRSRDDRRWLVHSVRDDGPDAWYLYERPRRTLKRLFSSRPELEGGHWSRMHAVVIPSRDGLDLVSYYTLPLASDPDGDGHPKAPVPMVMVVHGGPGDERAEYGFFPLVQWLNNRGYGVFIVNFRGSPGFGKKFVNAEQLEWGGKMQDDLVDQARWAVAKGIARKDGIALFGGSYGGYATLCGMTFSPDVFACGIDVVGPADLETFMSTIPPSWSLDHFAKRVGDPRTEEGRAHLRSRSPIHFIDRVTKPILIAQGSNDSRVPQAQSDRMAHALDSLGVSVTYLVYPDEGHGFLRAENNRSFYAITDAFLARCLGGRAAPIENQLEGSSVTVPVGASRIPGLEPALARRATTSR